MAKISTPTALQIADQLATAYPSLAASDLRTAASHFTKRTPAGTYLVMARDDGTEYTVDLESRACSCGATAGRPCTHRIAARILQQQSAADAATRAMDAAIKQRHAKAAYDRPLAGDFGYFDRATAGNLVEVMSTIDPTSGTVKSVDEHGQWHVNHFRHFTLLLRPSEHPELKTPRDVQALADKLHARAVTEDNYRER